MKFITAKEFLEQSAEVQAIFLNWWEPEVGDLFNFSEPDDHDYREVECICSTNILRTISLTRIIPLFTEGQLRQFIEDACGYIDLRLENINDDTKELEYSFSCFPYVLNEGFSKNIEFIGIEAIDLLHAYWKVAVKIAKTIIEQGDNNEL